MSTTDLRCLRGSRTRIREDDQQAASVVVWEINSSSRITGTGTEVVEVVRTAAEVAGTISRVVSETATTNRAADSGKIRIRTEEIRTTEMATLATRAIRANIRTEVDREAVADGTGSVEAAKAVM